MMLIPAGVGKGRYEEGCEGRVAAGGRGGWDRPVGSDHQILTAGEVVIIRHGVTRTVLLTRRYAIKLPSLRSYGDGAAGLLWSICRGILANQSEAEWWRNAEPQMRAYLCPVLRSWFGGIMNFYPRCGPYEPDETTAEKMFAREWSPVELLYPHPGDNKPDNYGWLDGRIVCLDYDMNYNGCPHDRSGVQNRIEYDADSVRSN